MKKPKVAFIVYGVHKDGLLDPMGTPFIDDELISKSIKALADRKIDVVRHQLIVATKPEAREALAEYRDDSSIDGVILFSGTWVWAAHMTAAIRDFARTGRPIVIWTHPGSQGWRPVGGLVMTGALKEIGVPHRFVYGSHDSDQDLSRISTYLMAGQLKRYLEMKTVCSFGGRGMGQSCGVCDPSQWMKVFGIDIDSRDTTALMKAADAISELAVEQYRLGLDRWFVRLPEKNKETERSIRLLLAMRQLMSEWAFDFYTIQSFPGLGDDYSATCFMQSMMLNDRIPVSTLGDFNTLMTTIILNAFSTEAVYYGDMQHVDKQTNEIKIIGDGAVPPSLAGKRSGGKADFASHGIPTEGGAGGLSVSLVAKAGTGALARLGRTDGRFQMALTRCDVFEPEEKDIQRRLNECGIPFWPHAFLRFEGDADQFMAIQNNEYACLGYGADLYACVADFCELCDIELLTC